MELKKASIDDLQDLQDICIRAYASHFADHWIDNGLSLHLEYQYGSERLASELADEEVDFFLYNKTT